MRPSRDHFYLIPGMILVPGWWLGGGVLIDNYTGIERMITRSKWLEYLKLATVAIVVFRVLNSFKFIQ